MLLPSQFTPKEIYDWYTAGLDLLPDAGNPIALPAPNSEETFTAYRARVGDETILHCGDVLFAFLIVELTGAGGNTRRAVRRLDRAIRDLTQLRIKLLRKQPNEPLCTTVTTLEDGSYTFVARDFGLIDPPGNIDINLLFVKIMTLPQAGTLKLNGVAVTPGQVIAVANLNNLVFTPPANAYGDGYAGLTFQVQNSNGTPISGIDPDPAADTITIDVTSVNDAPAGTDKTVTVLEDHGYTFGAADFFSDPIDSPRLDAPGNSLLALKITTLPAAGTLKLDGVNVTAGQSIAVADLGKLVYAPAANANGTGYASFTFQVQDDGGTANGGVDLDQSANTITVDVTSVNDAPAGADKTVTIDEDASYTFSSSDFGFTDSNDSPANSLLAVKIATLPAAGTLKLDGVAVAAGDSIAVADLDTLVFTPAANTNGTGYASFTFQVQDDGGTANSGANRDQSPNTITIDVLPAASP